MARVKAENALVPVHRKELRKVLVEYLQWIRAIKKDPTFQKEVETQRELKDTEGSNRQNLLSISANSCSIECL